MSSSPTRSQRAAPLPPEERRTAIIEAVLPLLCEQGSATTSRDLAAAAGVSEGTIFKVFKDKDDLLCEALARAVDTTALSEAIDAIDRALPFTEQLAEAVVLIQRRVVDLWQLISKLEKKHHGATRPGPLTDSPALTALFADHDREVRLDPAEAATLLRALTLSLTHPMLVTEPRPPAEIIDLFLNGAGMRT